MRSPLFLLIIMILSPFALADGWLTNIDEAKAAAKAGGKSILIEFSAAGWQEESRHLRETLLDTEEFKKGASDRYILLRADFPQKIDELSAARREHNERLRQAHGIATLPTLLLTDADGNAYAKASLHFNTTAPFIEHLDSLKAMADEKFSLFAKASSLEGLEKARLLGESLKAMPAGNLPPVDARSYSRTRQLIIELDPDDTLGYAREVQIEALREKLELRLQQLYQKADYEGALGAIETFLATKDLQLGHQFDFLTQKFQLLMALKRYEEAKATLVTLTQVAPSDPITEQIKEVLEGFDENVATLRENGNPPEGE